MATAKATPDNQETKTETGSLQDFTFNDDDSFFGVKNEPEDSGAAVITEVKADKKPGSEKAEDISKTSTKAEEEAEEENEVTFFETDEEKAEKQRAKKEAAGEDEEDENTEVEEVEEEKTTKVSKKKDAKAEETEEKTEDDDTEVFTTLAKELKEKGILSAEIKDDEVITQEKFFELQDAEVEARVNETFEAFLGEMDDEGKAFLKFKKAGGKTADFISAYQNNLNDLDSLDIEKEEDRVKVLTHYVKTVEKLDDADVKDRLEWLKDSGKDKIYAKKAQESLAATAKTRQEAVVKAQEQMDLQREADAKAFNESLLEVLTGTESIGSFSITENDKKELSSYLTKPTVKVGKNKYVPAFQAAMADIFRADTPEKKQKLVLLGKLVKSNFDTKDIVTDIQTKVVKKVKSKIADIKRGVKPHSAGGAAKKSLTDFFQED